MARIEKYAKRVRKKIDQLGPIEADPEYQLIVEVSKSDVMLARVMSC